METSDINLLDGLKDWLDAHCKRNSQSWIDYERAKSYMRSAGFDHMNWQYGIVMITDYLVV